MLHGALRFLERWHAALILGQAVLVAIVALTRKGDSKRVGTFDKARLTLAMAAVACDAVVFADGDARWSEVLFNMGALVLVTCTAVAEARKGRKEDGVMRLVYVQIGAGAAYAAFKKVHEDAFPLACARAAATIAAALLYALFNAGARSTRAKRTATSGDYVALEEAEELEDEESPEDAAGPLSCAAFYWLSPLLATGYRRPLLSADLFPLVRNDKPSVVHAQALEGWEKRASLKIKSGKRLLRALTGAFGGHYLVGSLFKLGYDTTQLLVPLLLSAFLVALGDGDDKKAYMVSAGIVFNAALSTALLHQYFQRTYRTGMRLKSAAVSLVYSKALVVAREASWEDGVAVQTTSITNLMSVDAQRLQDNMTYLMSVVSGIYQIVVCLYLLDRELGVSAFGGFAVMLVFMPVTQRIVLLSRSQQKVVLTNKDARIKLQAEALGGIKIVKLYGWEGALSGELKRLRGLELAALWQYKLVSVLSRVVFNVVPTAVSLVTFSMYVLLGHDLSVPKVYTSLALFNVLRFPLMMVPTAVSSAVEGMLSVDRIAAFLVEPEVQQHRDGVQNPMSRESSKDAVFSTDASVSWVLSDSGADRQCFLRHVSFNAKRGDLVAIVGETGSGKSGLFACLLGEASVVAGAVGVVGSVAYAAQTPWIQNATLRENVLFGAPYDDEKYRDTIFRCALEPDLEQLADGDATAIGEKGLNLSGGQKQRVALARAFYADADVYLLDDPLSAVDAHVARHLFENLIVGGLQKRGKTVLLATHNLSTLPKCDAVLQLHRGTGLSVKFFGTAALFQEGNAGLFKSESHSSLQDAQLPATAANKALAHTAAAGDKAAKDEEKEEKDAVAKGGNKVSPGGIAAAGDFDTMDVGKTSRHAQKRYLAAYGGIFAVATAICAQIGYQASQVLANWWLGYWAGKDTLGTAEGLEVYTVLSLVSIFLSCFAYYLMARCGQKAAHVLHDLMLDAVLASPMAFFDSTPLGRLLNLFSKDLYTIDEELPTTLTMWVWVGLSCLATLLTIAFATPEFGVVAVPLGLVYYATQNYFIPSVRQLKRLDAASRTPVFSAFEEATDGATTIRAFGAEQRFVKEMMRRLDNNLKAYFLGTACNRWLAVRLELIGTVCTGAAAFLAVLAGTDQNVAGLSLTYALSVTQALNWFVRMNADLENNSVAVERVIQCADLKPEDDAMVRVAAPAVVDASWPWQGRVQVRNLSLRYRAGLPLVLNNLTFVVEPGSKLGLVGRTGSGKSSFLLALLRIVPPEKSASVVIDGVDVAHVSLATLRTRVSMIPQDPVLFSGSIRMNLDPFNAYSDAALLDALRLARVDASRLLVQHSDASDAAVLGAVVDSGGKNFSIGERQLLCLARACVRKSRLVLLDEATSAVDYDLDKLVQNTIRDAFRDSTVIAIAHRLDTVLDYTRIIVLDAGRIVEDGPPQTLINTRGSKFAAMAAAYASGAAD